MTQELESSVPVLFSSAVICFCAGGLYGWSALIPVVETKFHGTAGQSGLVFSVAIVAFSIAVMLTPRLPPLFGGLRGCALFGTLGSGCLGLSIIAPTYSLFLVTFGVGFGGCSGAIYINALGNAAKAARQAIVTPLIVAGFGMGGAVFGLIWRTLIVDGWGSMAIGPLACALLLASFFAWMVASRTRLAELAVIPADKPVIRIDKPFAFVLLWLGFALGSAGGLMVLGLAGKMTDSVGASVFITSVAVAGVAVGNTVGRLSVSGFNQVFKPINTALLAVGFASIGLIVTSQAVSAEQLTAGLVIVAMGYGAVASIIPVLVGAIYGRDGFAGAFSMVFSAWGVAGLVAPWLAGVIHDKTGEFTLAIHVALLATLGSAAALLVLKISPWGKS